MKAAPNEAQATVKASVETSEDEESDDSSEDSASFLAKLKSPAGAPSLISSVQKMTELYKKAHAQNQSDEEDTPYCTPVSAMPALAARLSPASDTDSEIDSDQEVAAPPST